MTTILTHLRSFPLTAPFIAAADTLIAVVKGNITALLAEPLVVLGSLYAVLDATVVDSGLGWKGYVVAYVTAAARFFTTPALVE